MSRIDELKKQNPHLNLTLFDAFKRVDISKTNKYSHILTFMANEQLKKRLGRNEEEMKHIKRRCKEWGLDCSGLSSFEIYQLFLFFEQFVGNEWGTVRDFMDYMERGIIDNKDVLTYKNMEDVKSAVSLASIKFFSKELESQVTKEFEDETWVAVRPLSFEASAKYGASTKWCTTYSREKEYFAKYFSRGVLVYFINKKTGYKFALYSEVFEDHNDISFWNAEDTRVDFLQIDIDTYLLPVIKELANSKIKNSELLHPDELEKVFRDCDYIHRRDSQELIPVEENYEYHNLLQTVNDDEPDYPTPRLNIVNSYDDNVENGA